MSSIQDEMYSLIRKQRKILEEMEDVIIRVNDYDKVFLEKEKQIEDLKAQLKRCVSEQSGME